MTSAEENDGDGDCTDYWLLICVLGALVESGRSSSRKVLTGNTVVHSICASSSACQWPFSLAEGRWFLNPPSKSS